jgi:CBS domain-containing protein
MRVYKLMSTPVVSVERETTLRDVARLLSERAISGVPVVDDAGRVVGVVSEADIIATERPRETPRLRVLGLLLRPETASELEATLLARTAGEAMSSPAITVRRDCPHTQAAAVMRERRINRLPVVDDDNRLVGIVSRADLVRAFARDDDEIAKEIRSDVVLGGIVVAPGTIEVTVDRGVVTLTGEVETKGKADLLVAFVRRVAGVVSVDSQVTWRSEKGAPRGIRAPA